MTWKTFTFATSLVIVGILAYDINVHGSFEKSNVGRLLKSTDTLHHAQYAWEESKHVLVKYFNWAKVNIPIFCNEYLNILKPYLQLIYELGLVFFNTGCRLLHELTVYSDKKAPVVQAWVSDLWTLAQDYLQAAIKGALFLTEIIQSYVLDALDYAKKNIFVGSISPENLRRYTLEALNTTQVYASNTFHWVYEKFQTS